MPHLLEAPFYYLSFKCSFFSSRTYLWSSDKAGETTDLSYNFLKQLKQCPKGSTPTLYFCEDKKITWPSVRKKRFKLSLEVFDELDELGPWHGHASTISLILTKISALIGCDNAVGINFREVFLVQEGETPPSHFRPGIDICVTSEAEYKKKRDRFSYQLGKFIFNEFKSPFELQEKWQSPLSPPITWSNYQTPFKDYYYFDSALVCHTHFYQFVYKTPSATIPSIFAFISPISIIELVPLLQCYKLASQLASNQQEMTLVFKGSHYENALERQQLYDDLTKLIAQSECTFMVHVILITKDNLEFNLLDLKPNTQEKLGQFQPLAQGAGYSLSSPEILVPIYRNIQTIAPSFDDWLPFPSDTIKKPQIQKSPGAYIHAQEVSQGTRKSKTLTQGQLKSKVKLSVSHQETIAQTQVVNEQVQEIQALNLEQEFNCSSEHSTTWDSKTNLDGFCQQLEVFAKIRLPLVTKDEHMQKQGGYVTQFYLKNHSRRHFYEQLANNKNFRLQIAARLFGNALIESSNESDDLVKIQLPHLFIDNIEKLTGAKLCNYIERIQDGLPLKKSCIQETYFYGRTLYDINSLPLNYKAIINPPPLFSNLASHNTDSNGFQFPLNYFALLTYKDLASVKPAKRKELIHIAGDLLKLFQPHSPLSSEEIHSLEEKFLDLMTFYFPDQPQDLICLHQFISRFAAHNEDNLKILLQIIISKHKEGMKLFFGLLSFLEKRALLDNFYKIYFQYAVSIGSVDQLLKAPHYDVFLQIALRTPTGTSIKELPIFEKFMHSLLVFLAKNAMSLHPFDVSKLESLFQRLYLKFLSYSGNQEEDAQKLMNNLIQQLINEDGLCIASFTNMDTFYTGLEDLLDHAMEKHVLKEQIEEIQEVSLLPADAPYACKWNGFKLICPEMQIHASTINPLTKSYAISNAELLQAIKEHKPGDAYLKTALFRYLGTQSLRENIAFYRTLYQATIQTQNETAVYISQLLCTYYVATFTGNGYCHDINETIFSENFIGFLRKHHLNKTLSPTQISTCINDFFLHLHQMPIDKQNGIQSLWSIWRKENISAFKIAKTPIPEIFLRKFAAKKLGFFLLSQKENLQKELHALNSDLIITKVLINQWLTEYNSLEEHKKIIRKYLKTLYPRLDMGTLLQNITKMASFFESMSSIFRNNPKSMLYLAMDTLIENNADVDAFLCLIELLAAGMEKHPAMHNMATSFLLGLAKKPQLFATLPQAKMLINVLMEAYLTIEVKEGSALLLNLTETLLPLGINEAELVIPVLISMVKNNNGFQFLNTHSYLNAPQLKEATKFIQNVQSSLAFDILNWLYEKDSTYDLTELNTTLNDKTSEEIQCLLMLAYTICQSTNRDILEELQQLQTKSLNGLKKLVQLHQLYRITTEEILTLLNSPSLDEAIALFQRQKYQENPQRYYYEPQVVKAKIAQIRLKSHQAEDEFPLSNEEQNSIWHDYQLLMSYMAEKPIKVEVSGITKECTIYNLEEHEFPILFKTLQEQISKRKEVHHDYLLLIALSAEALYRTTNKFPRSTQILALLKRLHYLNNSIHEIKTGEGKSITAAIFGVLLCSLGKTTDIATENNQLAKKALEKFSPFYQYLGIPHGKNIITPQSAHCEYVANGINYSTASNLSLFRTRMALEKKALPENPALICDEIDAILTNVVQFRLAATLDPLQNDTKSWAQLYQLILDFVQEKEIYHSNPCTTQEDIFNLRNYFITKKINKDFLAFTSQISDELLDVLIESAMVAHELKEKVDYYIVETKKSGSTHYYAAPIISSTKRPDPNVSYAEHVQQLLHTLLNSRKPAPTYPFIIEPCTKTLVTTTAKNFFDYYRINNGLIIGLTGTAGSYVELAEFYEQQNLVAFKYPTFNLDLSEDLGLVTAFGTDDHFKKVFDWIVNHKKQKSAQPILLITRSPQATEQLHHFIAINTQWKLQCYHGYEEAGKSEEDVIYTAGKEDYLTIVNQSLGRGADFEPEHEDGLLVINTCTDLTPSDLRQIQGRAARNGKCGQFISIIDAQAIGLPSDSEEILTQAFKTHQHNISINQQQERLKIRLLGDTRYLIVNKYILKFRETADAILARQLGEGASIVSHENLLRTLSTLNQRIEKYHADLLEKHNVIDEDASREFLAMLVQNHQEILDQWFPENKYNEIQFIEPSIPLDALTTAITQLKGTRVEQLSALASIFHCQWKIEGHQKTIQNFQMLDSIIETFDSYLKKKCSFNQALGQALDKNEVLTPQKIDTIIVEIKTSIDEMLNYAQAIPVIGNLLPIERIKKFITNYLNTTKAQIKEKRWDEVRLPEIDISGVKAWFNGISTTLTMSSIVFGGPIPFIVKSFILPTVLGWIKNKLKKQFSDSESLIAQMLIALDDIGDALSEMIKALNELSEEKERTMGFFLDRFSPLVKNKALLLALTKYLELTKQQEYIPFVQAMPAVFDILEIYRDRTLDNLVTIDTLIEFLQQASHSEPILKLLENSPYKECLEQTSQLDAHFISQISTFSLPAFFNLLKVIAHPDFFTLLNKLPAGTTYEQLCQWLEHIPENLSPNTRQAIQELLDYQTDPERIAKENEQALQNLRTLFSLSTEKLKTELDNLKPQIFKNAEETTTILEPQTSQSNYFSLIHASMFLIPITLLICSVIYLSISLAFTSLFIFGWLAFPHIQEQIYTWRNAKHEQSMPEQNPLHLLNKKTELLSNPNQEAQVHKESLKTDTMDLQESKLTITDSIYSFFAQKIFKKTTLQQGHNYKQDVMESRSP
ncbi:MAG: preprotein translocase subunit SecA [Legionella sp.]|uniref:preprotein translocase subunit SecA n=1 Tax=Legionella sp. TaxID=459 RepID=UPI0039E40B77